MNEYIQLNYLILHHYTITLLHHWFGSRDEMDKTWSHTFHLRIIHLPTTYSLLAVTHIHDVTGRVGGRHEVGKTWSGVHPGLLWFDIVQAVQAQVWKLQLPMATPTLGNRAWLSLKPNRWRHIEAHGQIRPIVCRRMGRLVLQCIPLLSPSTPWFEILGLYGVMQLQAGLQNDIGKSMACILFSK